MGLFSKYLKPFACNGGVAATGVTCYFISKSLRLPLYIEQVSCGLTAVGVLAVISSCFTDDSRVAATLEELDRVRSDLKIKVGAVVVGFTQMRDEVNKLSIYTRNLKNHVQEVNKLSIYTRKLENHVQEAQMAVLMIRKEHREFRKQVLKELLAAKCPHDHNHDEKILDESAKPDTSKEHCKYYDQNLNEATADPRMSEAFWAQFPSSICLSANCDVCNFVKQIETSEIGVAQSVTKHIHLPDVQKLLRDLVGEDSGELEIDFDFGPEAPEDDAVSND